MNKQLTFLTGMLTGVVVTIIIVITCLSIKGII